MNGRALVAAALAVCVACAAPGAGGGGDVTVLTGGSIRLAAEGPVVEALAVRDGRVVAHGSADEVRAAVRELGAPAVEVDLCGGVAVPGLQDAHGHLESLGASLESVDLAGVASYDELVQRVAERAATLPAGAWITGRGWDQTRWPGRAFPHHAALSAAVPDHPVLLARVDGHAALANARALAIAGLDREIADSHPVAGGEILLGPDGRATGVLVDTAVGLVARHVPAPDRATRRRRLLAAQEALLASGLTCAHDMGVPVSTVELLDELRRDGLLRLRVVCYLAGNDGLPDDVLARFPRTFGERQRLAVPGVKLMADGALGSRGAALLEDYSDRPGTRGLLRLQPDELEALVLRYARAGLQPAVHAIGDAANRMVLDVYERAEREVPEFAALRPRVEHAQVVAPGDWGRFAALGAIPSMQPVHATSDMRWAEERLGPRRLRGAYAWRRLAPDATVLAFGSDFPVERPDPLEGLYAARTRTDREGRPSGGWMADQALDGVAALRAFTQGAARAALQDERGRLDLGRPADLTVLTVDPVTCESEELLTARVLLTVVDGEIAYDGRGLAGAPSD